VTRDDIRKLIGGYATGTLTETERRMLFEAALDDQELFDELSREQALKELLEEPGAKQRLLAALEKPARKPAPIAWWRRPWPWALAATVVLGVALTTLLPQRTARPTEVAVVSQPAPPPPPVVKESNQPIPAPRATPAAKKAKPAPAAEPQLERRDSKDVTAEKDQKTVPEKSEVAASAPVAQQVPVQAAPQSPRVQQEQATSGAVGGVAGGLAPSLAKAKSAAFASKMGRFAFDYSVESDRYLSVKVTGDGYLAVGVASPKNFQLIPIAGNGRVSSGSTTRLKIPEGAEELVITFAARPTDLVDRVNAVSGNKDGTSGSLEDPNPSPDSKLIATVRISK
jgi:hypothetical protein